MQAARSFAPLAIFEATHQLSAGPSKRPCETAEEDHAGTLALFNPRDARLIGAGGQAHGFLGHLEFFAALADDVSEGR